eukprot:732611-Rhodomonas_salina.2
MQKEGPGLKHACVISMVRGGNPAACSKALTSVVLSWSSNTLVPSPTPPILMLDSSGATAKAGGAPLTHRAPIGQGRHSKDGSSERKMYSPIAHRSHLWRSYPVSFLMRYPTGQFSKHSRSSVPTSQRAPSRSKRPTVRVPSVELINTVPRGQCLSTK